MKHRIGYIDIVRGISMICVMLSHSGMGMTGPHIGSFFIPIFFFISGFTFSPEKFATGKDLLKVKAKRLLQPYLLFYILLLMVYNIPFGWSMKDSLIGFFKSIYMNAVLSPLWFLPALFVMYMIYYFLYRISNKQVHLLLFSVLCSTIGYLLYHFHAPLLPWNVDSVLSCIIFFCTGHLLKTVDLSIFYKWYYLLLMLLVNLFISYYNGGATISVREFGGNYLLFYIGAFSGIFAYLIISIWIDKHTIYLANLLKYIGRNTIIYLGLHRLIFTMDMLVFTRIPYINTFVLSIKGSLPYGIMQTVIAIICLVPVILFVNKKAKFMIGM